MNRHSGTPELLNDCPGTFSAACQSCGRTFLGLLTAWPAALLPAFAAFLLLTSGNASAQDSVESDRAVLVALYNATDGPNWTYNTNWLSNEPLSEWSGVGVNDDGRVTLLYLSGTRLTGEIPAELSQLSQLQELSLSRNQLTGEIPAELGNLAQLQYLYLGRNQLTGEIPAELSQLSQLQRLGLFSNQLTGEIPVELSQLSQLQYLILDNNQLTGEIPAELSQLSQLEWLDLDSNQLTGEIPAELGQLSQLLELSLDSNRLTGEIPVELSQLSQLLALYLDSNQLTGEIPAELSQLSQLRVLYLDSNQLTGEIPAELSQLSQLRVLYLYSNQLTGEIPVELGQLTRLENLYLYSNQLTGEIPVELGQLTRLENLFLYSNQLTGEIPAELSQLSQLEWLILFNNQLTGEIPAELSQLSQLEWLILSSNQLTGEIPAELGNLAQLQSLYLGSNQLTGEIPAELGNLAQLTRLYLHSNELTGSIPSWLVNLTELRELSLDSNQLTGEIPAELSQLSQLLALYLDSNQLTGEIPVELGNLAQLTRLYLHSNELTGSIPSWLVNLTELRELSLWSNQLTGTIPPEVAPAQDRAALRVLFNATDGPNWTDNTNWARFYEPLSEWHGVSTDEQGRVEELRLSANGLNGTIGAELGVLTRLTGLYLNDNELSGTLPPELGNLTQLQVFDIRNTGLCVTADSELHTWIATIQDFQGTATCQLVLDFAHFANGAAIVSDLVLINAGTAPTRPALYFYDQAGAPIAAESVVDVLGDLVVREDGALSVQTELESLGELTISTHGQGVVVSGSLKVVSDSPIGGFIRFDLPGIGVAGVGASQPASDAIFPARRQAGGISTAAAIHNPGAEAMAVSCRLMKEGTVLEEVEIDLAANGQDARFIEEVFPRTDTSDFVGSVRCTAPEGGRFTGVAVELDAANRIFTTLPVVPVDSMDAQDQEGVLDFAHFANGAAIVSDLVLINAGTAPTRPALYFYDQAGAPIAAESVVDVLGDLVVREDGALSVQTELESLGELTISTHGQGVVVSGSLKVVSDSPIGGFIRFDLPGIGVAGVGASQPASDAIFPARRQAGGISTAAAIHNPGAEAMAVSCRLMKEGTVLEEVEIDLAANGQQARFIDQMFPRTDTSDFVGSVRCTAPEGGRFTGVAVELDAANRIFTTLPVVPVPERMSQE